MAELTNDAVVRRLLARPDGCRRARRDRVRPRRSISRTSCSESAIRCGTSRSCERTPKNYDLDPSLLAAVIYTESRFNAGLARTPARSGLMQLLPDTAAESRCGPEDDAFVVDDLYSPELNVRYGSWYSGHLLDRYGDERTALAAYHAGPGKRRHAGASRASESSSRRRGATSPRSSTSRTSMPDSYADELGLSERVDA